MNADIRKEADKQMYRTNAEKKKYALKKHIPLMLMELKALCQDISANCFYF